MNERIICAAIWYKDLSTPKHTVTNLEKGVVLCGHRHHNIIGQCVSLLGKKQYELGESVQGFLTSKNRFVDRMEAAVIAKREGQLVKDQWLGKELYSENIY